MQLPDVPEIIPCNRHHAISLLFANDPPLRTRSQLGDLENSRRKIHPQFTLKAHKIRAAAKKR